MTNKLNSEEIKTYIKRLVNDVTDIALALALPAESFDNNKKTTTETTHDASDVNDIIDETTESSSKIEPNSTSKE